jgi:hypothetical protein
MKERKLTTDRYDVAGNGINRSMRLYVLSRVVPIGDYGWGRSFRFMMTCWLLHYWGKLLCFLVVFFQGPTDAVFKYLEKRRHNK